MKLCGEDDRLLERALRSARDTRQLDIGHGARRSAAEMFARQFGSAACQIIADENTFAAAGRDVYDAFRLAGKAVEEPLLLPGDVYAEYPVVPQICAKLRNSSAIPLAVGSGTLNDLTKRAAHECGRPYMVVATAASMDGYTAFGASLTLHGSKQTFDCPAPRAVIADLEVIARAPAGMNAAGYADLVAKCPAGGDWIVADGLGEESIDPDVWDTVQNQLRSWIADPRGVRDGELEPLRNLTVGLMMTGFAMQAARSSRPASGAEHQFSHLWDMEHHQHNGRAPSHGSKVGIGSLASVALYESLLAFDMEELDVRSVAMDWPDAEANDREISNLFDVPELADKARLESSAKLVTREQLQLQVELLKRNWPRLRERLTQQLLSQRELRDMLAAAGAPAESSQIGIPRARLRQSYLKAYHIRRRFTVLDLARRTGLLSASLDSIFGELKDARE